MSRLPVPEPTIFSGEPIQYPDWQSSFHALIDRENSPSSDKMYYLKRYVSGSAKEAISGLFLQNSSEAYERPWNFLDERFGHPFIITKAYRDKLQRWPKIGVRDHQSLRKFADFLSSVKTAMQVIQGLNFLNDYIENQKFLTKLPDWLISRWNREANKCLREEKAYPHFNTYVTFITAEADLICNLISSCNAVKEAEALDNVRKGQKTKDIRENKTNFSAKTTEESSKVPNGNLTPQPKCTFCKKMDHHLDACLKFQTEVLKNRITFVKENRLCFGCLKKGHASRNCRKRLACTTCNKKHPTCLHADKGTSEKKEDISEDGSVNVPKSTSCTSQGVLSTSTSMIVPLWLSSSSRPEKEVLDYSILDTQSAATFILKETCHELDTETQPTKLRLSTITSQESLIDSQRVSNLQARGYNSDLKIPTPIAYPSTSIAADEDHIPTKTTAKNWDHLRPIEDKMHDSLDCNVGLLIGYDCSQALTPTEVIVSESNEPYGIKTDLGWSIVGGSDVKSGRSFCHRVAVKELPAVTMNDIVRILESDLRKTKTIKRLLKKICNSLRLWKKELKEPKMDTMKCHCHSRNGLYCLTIARWR